MTKRKTYLDFLRIIAIMMVLFNHRVAFYSIETLTRIDASYLIKTVFSILAKCGAPFFFMISGTLLLEKEEKFSRTFTRRIVRMLIVMALCSIFFILAYNEPGNFKVKLNWYFYAYIGFLLMMPFLGLIARHANKAQVILFLTSVFVIYSAYGICWYFWQAPKEVNKLFLHLYVTDWPSDCWLIIFTVSGYFLSHLKEKGFSEKEEKRLGAVMGVLAAFSLIMGIIGVIAAVKMSDSQYVERMRQWCIYAPACFLFWGCRRLFERYGDKLPEKCHTLITSLGATVFGIFIIENQTTLSYTIFGWIDDHTSAFLGPYLPSLLSVLAEFVIYAAIIMLVRLIPGVKKLI